jgi:hypothetical protein
MRRGLYFGLAVMVTVSVLVALLPARKLALDLACQPVGLSYRLKSRVQRAKFWRRQVIYLDREITWYASLPARVEGFRRETDKAVQENRRFREETYQKNLALRPSAAEQTASELRKLADDLERKEMQAREAEMRQEIVRKLQACRVTASSRGNTQ